MVRLFATAAATRLPTDEELLLARKRLARRILWGERLVAAFTLLTLALGHGVQRLEAQLSLELGVFVAGVMGLLTAGFLWRAWLSGDVRTFLVERPTQTIVHTLWLALAPLVAEAGVPGLAPAGQPLTALLRWTELMFWLRTVAVALRIIRQIAAARANPAVVFVASYVVLIAMGTLLLALPVARQQPADAAEEVHAPLLVALFTATSASCVTGLIVVPTPTYWSQTGQLVILGLIQLGGLGVMTFGAFFALGQRRGFLVRESVFMGKLLEADDMQAVRRLVLAILLFTLLSELAGTLLLMTAAPPGPWTQRLYFGLFHAVSAFCNAGFALQEQSFVGHGGQWQVWGVLATLIILGGLGFEVLRNAADVVGEGLRRRLVRGRRTSAPPRLTVTSRLVLTTTAGLLVVGGLAFFVLEQDNTLAGRPLSERLAESWFQSVTFRTAGFNTVDFQQIRPATQLLGIALMFIGASPGSTGGGIKTVVFALLVLATAATVSGRERVEVAARTIPDSNVQRAAAVAVLGLVTLLTSTFLLVLFEQREDRFLDHLFEATSALGTVGLSTLGTDQLRPASQVVLIVTMFAGRVGPLTLLVALARKQVDVKYEYPSERVMLG
jgi:trk system potassium uptake protein TrkH